MKLVAGWDDYNRVAALVTVSLTTEVDSSTEWNVWDGIFKETQRVNRVDQGIRLEIQDIRFQR